MPDDKEFNENPQDLPELTPDTAVGSPEGLEQPSGTAAPYDGATEAEPQKRAENASRAISPQKSRNKKKFVMISTALLVLIGVFAVAIVLWGDNWKSADDSGDANDVASIDQGDNEEEETPPSGPISVLDITGRDLTEEEALTRECLLHPNIGSGYVGRHWNAEGKTFTSVVTDPEYAWIFCDWGLALKVVPGMDVRGKTIPEEGDYIAYFDGITTDTDFYKEYDGTGWPGFYKDFVYSDSTANLGLVGVSRIPKQEYDEIIEAGGGFGSSAPLLVHKGYQYTYSGSQAPYSEFTDDDKFLLNWELESRSRLLEWISDQGSWTKF